LFCVRTLPVTKIMKRNNHNTAHSVSWPAHITDAACMQPIKIISRHFTCGTRGGAVG